MVSLMDKNSQYFVNLRDFLRTMRRLDLSEKGVYITACIRVIMVTNEELRAKVSD
jgi:hypothetical protein